MHLPRLELSPPKGPPSLGEQPLPLLAMTSTATEPRELRVGVVPAGQKTSPHGTGACKATSGEETEVLQVKGDKPRGRSPRRPPGLSLEEGGSRRDDDLELLSVHTQSPRPSAPLASRCRPRSPFAVSQDTEKDDHVCMSPLRRISVLFAEIDMEEVDHLAASTRLSAAQLREDAQATTDKNDVEAMADLPYNIAAQMLQDALEGRAKHGICAMHRKSMMHVRAFTLQTSTAFLIIFGLAVMLLCSLVLFEEEHRYVAFGLGVVAISVIYLDIGLKIYYMGAKGCLDKIWNKGQLVLALLLTIDLCLLLGGLEMPFRFLRPWVMLCKDREVRRVYQAIISMRLVIVNVVAIIGVFLLVFGAIGIHVFPGDYDSEGGLGFSAGAPALCVHLGCSRTCG